MFNNCIYVLNAVCLWTLLLLKLLNYSFLHSFSLSTVSGILHGLEGARCKSCNFTHLSVTLWTITQSLIFKGVFLPYGILSANQNKLLVMCFNTVSKHRVIPALSLVLQASTFLIHLSFTYLTYMSICIRINDIYNLEVFCAFYSFFHFYFLWWDLFAFIKWAVY